MDEHKSWHNMFWDAKTRWRKDRDWPFIREQLISEHPGFNQKDYIIYVLV